MSLDTLISLFENPAKNFELEARLQITNDEWRSLFTKIITDYKYSGIIEQSITLSSKDERQEIYFTNGVKKEEKFIKKVRLSQVKFHKPINYRVSLSTEDPISAFNMYAIDEVRLRFRVALHLVDLPDWEIDFTYVKQLDPSKLSELKKYKEKLFPTNKKFQLSDFLTHVESLNFGLKHDPQIHREIELEFKPQTSEQKHDVTNQINKAISFISVLLDPNAQSNHLYHEKLYEVAKLLLKDDPIVESFKEKFYLKQLVNQPVNFSREEYLNKILPNITDYFLSDKADGERCLLIIAENNSYFITSDNLIDARSLFATQKSAENVEDGKIIHILDTEVIPEKEDKKESLGYCYVFDILVHNQEVVTNLSMEEREKHIDKFFANIQLAKPIRLEKKILVHLTKDYATEIKELYSRKTRRYEIDGLIFTPISTKESKQRYNQPNNYFDMIVYKWKPPHQMTIDFLVMKIPDNLLGVKPYIAKENAQLYALFCGINYHLFKTLNLSKIKRYDEIFEGKRFPSNYFPIQFSPASDHFAYLYYHPNDSKFTEKEISGHVVEFHYEQTPEDGEGSHWVIDRLRPDRDILVEKGIGFGNDFKTAESTFASYRNPITLEFLLGKEGGAEQESNSYLPPAQNYFAESKGNIYKPLTKFNAFVKAQMIRQLENSDWIIDLASGKGQDLFTINGFNIKNGLFVDLDKEALNELNRRKYELDKKEFYVYSPMPHSHMSVYTKDANLRDDYSKLIPYLTKDIPFPQKGVDGVIINFALHYLIESGNPKTLENFVNLIDGLLKPGGIFVFTCFNGEKIQKLLSETEINKSWDILADGHLKYSIKKLYQEDAETKKIGVVHPFSQGQYYEENLIDIPQVIEGFTNQGFHIRQVGSFTDWLDKFKRYTPKWANLLQSDDILYSSLYSYISLWKQI